LTRIGAPEPRMRVPVPVVSRPDGDVLRRHTEELGGHLRRDRLSPLPLWNRSEGEDDFAEDVQPDRGHLVVARKLKLRVQERGLAEIVRPGVEGRPDADPDEPAVLLPATLPDGFVVDQLKRD